MDYALQRLTAERRELDEDIGDIERELEGAQLAIKRRLESLSAMRINLADLDRAIAALEPQPPTPPRELSAEEREELIARTEADETEQANALTRKGPSDETMAMFHPYREASDDPARLVAEYYYGPDDGESEDIANVRDRIVGDEAEQQAAVDMAAAVERAKQAGAKAREAGEDSTACPYPQDSLEATAWTGAWIEPQASEGENVLTVTEATSERKAATLEDPELGAEYEAMKRRETADRKLHFSIFGKLENA